MVQSTAQQRAGPDEEDEPKRVVGPCVCAEQGLPSLARLMSMGRKLLCVCVWVMDTQYWAAGATFVAQRQSGPPVRSESFFHSSRFCVAQKKKVLSFLLFF
jgi:hypothetical protein